MDKNKMIRIKERIIYFSLAIIIIILCYGIVQLVLSLFKFNNDVIDIDNISKYIIKETYTDKDGKEVVSNIVKEYNSFYTVQNASENFIENLLNGNYEESYNVLSKEMKKKYSKTEYLTKIKEFTSSRLKSSLANVDIKSVDNISVATDFTLPLFSNSNNMKYVYRISDNVYIGETMDCNSKLFKIGFRLKNKKYEVFYIEF